MKTTSRISLLSTIALLTLLASLIGPASSAADASVPGSAVPVVPVAAPTRQDVPLDEVIVGDQSPLVSNTADSLPWGVVDLGPWTHISTDLEVPVYAIQQIGDRIFVGGSFGKVKKGRGGREEVQPFLAAFDVATGEWISDWRPAVDASVFALAATDDGKLIVGGDFNSVNGQPNTAAMVALDALTGEVLPQFRSGLERPWSTDQPVVRALEVFNGQIYAAGNFSHHVSNSARTRVYKAIRVSAANGDLDNSWLPRVTGAGLWSMAISPDGSRVTLGGYQTTVNAQPDTSWIGVVSGVTGASITGLVHQSTRPVSSAHIQAIWDDGDKLYYSGSQHFIFKIDTATWQLEEGTTYVSGGDGQAILEIDGIIYNGCHCYNNAYTNSYSWPTPTVGSTKHLVNGISAHTLNSFSYVDAFQPEVFYENGDGPWDLHYDTRGCMWVGGDVFRLDAEQPYRWARGFTRLCQDDAEAPTAPRDFTVSLTGPNQNQPVLTWRASIDNRDVQEYEIFRNGLLLATVTDTTFTDVTIAAPATYRVRAVDTRGNKSVTSDSATAAPVVGGEVLISAGSTWRYLDDGTNPGSAWMNAAFNDGAWKQGAGELGFGDGGETTTIASGNLQAFFRHQFEVVDPNATSLKLELLADDGAVVYLNGVEVLRENMPLGPLGFPAWPTAWKSGANENAYGGHSIANELVAGTNTIAVSVHNVSRSNNDFGFDLRLVKSSSVGAPQPRQLIGAGDTWRYLDNGSNQGTAWRELNFNDNTWSTGAAPLGYGEGDEATVIAEGQPRFITAYFRSSVTVPNASDFNELVLGLQRDDGAVVYVNGVEVVRDNMPNGTITHTTGADGYATGNAERRYHSFTVPASVLRDGVNVFAVEVHQTDPWSKDLSFDLTVTAQP